MQNLMRVLTCIVALFASNVASAADFIWGARGHNSGALYLVGQIVQGDYERFVSAIKSHGPYSFALYLRSGGGNTQEAIKIGRLVRRLSISTNGPLGSQENPRVASCAADVQAIGRSPPCLCASACTLIWFAGTMRTSLEIYIHSIKFDPKMYGNLSPGEAGRLYQQAMDELRAYLKEMDVNDKYYYMMTNVASANIERVFTSYGDDVSGWPPSYREWLYAKCGSPTNRNAVSWGKCTVDASDEATVRAIREFLASLP